MYLSRIGEATPPIPLHINIHASYIEDAMKNVPATPSPKEGEAKIASEQSVSIGDRGKNIATTPILNPS
jgi:hypothetical protein